MNSTSGDEKDEEERSIAIESLSNAQLIRILQFHDDDEHLTRMLEAELARRKTEGPPQQ
jgi:hypothetical protein